MRAATLALILLAGCAGERPISPASGASGACDVGKAQSYLGQTATPALAEAARKAASAVIARTITPDMMVTMEYRADRLNLTTDGQGKVASVRCG